MRILTTTILAASLSLCACAHEQEERLFADNPAALSSSSISSSTGSYAMAVNAAPSNGGVVRQSDCAENVNDILTHLELLMAQNQQAQN